MSRFEAMNDPDIYLSGEQRFNRALDVALTKAAIETQRVRDRHGGIAVASLEDFGLIEPVDSDDGP